jgi:hypothetical protein
MLASVEAKNDDALARVRGSEKLFDGVAVGVDFVDFAQV